MPRVLLIAPATLGQHSLSVGVSLEVSDEQAEQWRAEGVIAAPAEAAPEPEAPVEVKPAGKAPKASKADKPAQTEG